MTRALSIEACRAGQPVKAAETGEGPLAHRSSHCTLGFSRSPAGRTWLSDRFIEYPVHLTRPLYLDTAASDLATVYLQSMSGGLFQGDHHCLEVHVKTRARTHLTTQGATKVHSMRQGYALQETVVSLDESAVVEWMPDPLILFPDAAVRNLVRVVAVPGAVGFFTDGFLWHDPAGRPEPAFRHLETEFQVVDPEGALLVLDRQRLGTAEASSPNSWAGAAAAVAATGAGAGFRVHGTVFALTNDAERTTAFIEGARVALATAEGVSGGAGRLPNDAGAWARILAVGSVPHQRVTQALWGVFRSTVLDLSAPMRPK